MTTGLSARPAEQRDASAIVEIYERDARVVAFAWTSEYRPRHAYRGVALASIYVERAARGQGAAGLPSPN